MSVAAFARAADKAAPKASSPPSGKLRIGASSDAAEREADRVADAVMNHRAMGPEWSLSRTTIEPLLRRTCDCGGPGTPGGQCDQCNEKADAIRRAPRSHSGGEAAGEVEAPAIVHDVLRSPGEPLDAAARARLQPLFGHDFRQVRVHTDARAADSARSINARAYAAGAHIAFGAHQYAPGTAAGLRLLSHELAHVLQHPHTEAAPVVRREAAGEGDRKQSSLQSDFASCPEALQGDLRDNHRAALTHVARAITSLSSGFEKMDPNDKASFRHYFDPSNSGGLDDSFVREVRENYQRIGAYMRSVRFNCDPESSTICGSSKKWCVGGRLMWTCFGDLHVCTDAYASYGDPKFKIDTIIHESTHNALHTTDREYSSSKDFNRLSPRGSGILSVLSRVPIIGALFRLFRSNSDTLNNPDSYSGFAMHAGSVTGD